MNFGQKFPIFPLQEVVLLPHAVTNLYIFEERYRQMTKAVLDGSGQIAMAVLEGGEGPDDYQGAPPVRPAVCVGEIVQHEKNSDGTYNIAQRGECRARIVSEDPPTEERLFRQVQLKPTESPMASDDLRTIAVRDRLIETVGEGRLGSVDAVTSMLRQLDDKKDELPPSLAVDVLALGVLTAPDQHYRLLPEGDVGARGAMVRREVERYERMLDDADRQYDPDAPRGISWN